VTAQVARVSEGSPNRIEQLLRRFARLGKKEITLLESSEILAAFGLVLPARRGTGNITNLGILSGTDFERLITSLLEKMGFRAEMTKASGDGGIDIVAFLEKPLVGGRYLIQCKRFDTATQIGAPMVREFYGAVVADRKAIKGIFVTTTNFTTQAREFAHSLPLELIDGHRLQILLEQYQSR
jgi:restriction endonuclease Mrr